MPSFDIVKKCEVERTFRVSKVMADFDVSLDKANERFTGEIKIPSEWNVGLIVGGSGSGKTTIATELFGEKNVEFEPFGDLSVLDEMPKECAVEEIEKMFYSVGFGSVPSWFKPYAVLSNGEKMRVRLARELLKNNLTVFDEFTSVVDRDVARTCCIAVQKAVRKQNKKFVAISCHDDVESYLQPDWVFDTDGMQSFFAEARDQAKRLRSENAGETSGENLANIII